MQVETFSLDRNASTNVDIETAYSKTVANSQYLLSIFQYEEGLISALSHGGAEISDTPLIEYMLNKNGIIDDDKSISTFITTLIPYARFARQRHILSTHKGIVTSSMYRNVHIHVVTKDDQYAAHLLSYDQIGGVGIDDVYLSLSQPESLMAEIIPVLIPALGKYVGEKSLIAYDGKSLMANIISQLETKQ